MITMNYTDAIKTYATQGHKALAWEVIAALGVAHKAFDNALDWSMAGKMPAYVQLVKEYRATHDGKAPKFIRFDYVNGDIHIVSKTGEIIV